MSMTRKDYELIAQVICKFYNRAKKEGIPEAQAFLILMANELAAGFERDNPAFQRAKFFVACGTMPK